MPLRIAIVASLTVAACMVVPLSVNAVSSSSEDMSESADDPDPGDAVPIIGPIDASAPRDGTMGARASKAGHRPSLSGVGLAAAIIAGFLPSFLMMARSSRRKRAGPASGAAASGPPDSSRAA